MTPKKFYYGMIGLNVALILVIASATYFGTQLLHKQSEKLVVAKTENKVLENQQVSLSQAKKDIEKYNELNLIAKSIVPQDKDQARTIREINKIAGESGIKLKTISFQSSNLGAAAPAAQTQNPATQNGTATTPATTAPAPAAPTITQVKPVEGISGVFGLEIIVNSLETEPVPFNNLVTFLSKLESNRRTAHVTKINVSPKNNGRAVSFSLTLNAYVKP